MSAGDYKVCGWGAGFGYLITSPGEFFTQQPVNKLKLYLQA